MRRRKRDSTTFSLSFLDIMSCGFGAVVLVFLITKHSMSVHADEVNETLIAEVDRIEEDVRDGRADLVRLREALAAAERNIDEREDRASALELRTEDRRIELARLKETTAARERSIEALQSDVENLAEERQAELDNRSFGEDDRAAAARAVTGEGNRQYLTGLKVGGERILVLLDVSASMLDETIVNILRRRNMDAERRRSAPKWQRALATLEWIVAQFPITSRFQIYTFAEDWASAPAGSEGSWRPVSATALDASIASVAERLPAGGTDMESVFQAVGELSPLPDNVFLITDGLPTRGASEPRRGTVSGQQRRELFEDARRALPPGIPFNVILLPLEGDPMAASSFWKLAMDSGGTLLSPSEDWP